jgi:hypothetical protein
MQTAMAGAPSLRQEVTATSTAAVTSTPPVKRTQSLQLSPSQNENESTPIIRPLPTGAAPAASNDDSPVRPTLLSVGGRASSMRYGKHGAFLIDFKHLKMNPAYCSTARFRCVADEQIWRAHSPRS